jgi:3',5'-cyclic-AMP phosphodiesterase
VTKTLRKTHPQQRQHGSYKLIQLTDCHLYADPDADHKGVQPGRTLEAVCRHIAGRHPELSALLLTGDLSQDESVESYRGLKSAIAHAQLEAPAYAIPGNHDSRERMRAAFGDSIGLTDGFELGPWKIHLLDSSVPGETSGLVAEQELERLQRELARNPAAPHLIALHHHPIPVGSAWMDRIGLRNGDALNTILLRHEQVKAVVFGHIHQEFSAREGHLLYLGTPSTCIQFKPRSPLYAADTLPPACRVLNLHIDGAFETRIEYVAAG